MSHLASKCCADSGVQVAIRTHYFMWINVFVIGMWCAGSYQDTLLHMDQCDHDRPEHRLLAASPVWLQLYRATAEDLD